MSPLDLEPGERVDGWRIVRRIGRGGYAVVYEVEKDGQRFALKVACLTERINDPWQVDARARREVACLQQLRHPHVIRMWAHGRWPDPRSGFLYIVLDFVDGYTLERWVEQTHPTPHEVVVLFRKLFDALEHLHGHQVFHRDLSLRNILVSKDGEPVIIDFGAADYATADEVTDGPLPPCTPRNRSPEALRFWKAHQHDPEARYAFKATDDIFALGASLYDVLTDPTPTRDKRRPPLGGSVMAPPTPHRATQGRVPAELSAYAMTLIRLEPEDRPATAKDARRPLEEFARFEGQDWRGTPIHPVASQLPPEPVDAAPVPAPARELEGSQVPAASFAEGAVSPNSLRHAWPRRVLVGSLVSVVLAVAVAALVLHRPVPLAPAEKPTTRPSQLPSPLPTQKEASPSVTPPDTTPTLTRAVPPPPAEPKASGRRLSSKAQRCALLVFSLEWLGAGCAGVQTRPPPEDCPEGSTKAMEQELGWFLESINAPLINLDVTQPHPDQLGVERTEENLWAVYKDGPITGSLVETHGNAPAGTRVDGHLWTTGDRIYGRYVRARLPDGRTVPICLELTDGGDADTDVGFPKEKSSKPGHTVGSKIANSMAVERWR
ncbi:serine/threonine protein kinase [Hyalangium gracile]|uniref:serine/threonine protein kinase n=1 Tax=Hyalangium gracile TaxID=394092 RepID=UPI001CCA933B|nr:serine/threonine-protein kinase [Hyalangium gracile]